MERQVSARAEMTDFPALLEKLRQSQVFNEIESSQKEVHGKEIAPTLPEAQLGKQELVGHLACYMGRAQKREWASCLSASPGNANERTTLHFSAQMLRTKSNA